MNSNLSLSAFTAYAFHKTITDVGRNVNTIWHIFLAYPEFYA